MDFQKTESRIKGTQECRKTALVNCFGGWKSGVISSPPAALCGFELPAEKDKPDFPLSPWQACVAVKVRHEINKGTHKQSFQITSLPIYRLCIIHQLFYCVLRTGVSTGEQRHVWRGPCSEGASSSREGQAGEQIRAITCCRVSERISAGGRVVLST